MLKTIFKESLPGYNDNFSVEMDYNEDIKISIDNRDGVGKGVTLQRILSLEEAKILVVNLEYLISVKEKMRR